MAFGNCVFEIRHGTGVSGSPSGEQTNRVFGLNVSSFRVKSNSPETNVRPFYSENFQFTLLFFRSPTAGRLTRSFEFPMNFGQCIGTDRE